MKIDINELKSKNQKHFIIKEMIDDIEDLEFKLLEPVKVEFSLDFLSDGIYISGTFSTKIETTCVRCLNLYTMDLSGEIEGRYLDSKSYSEYMEAYDEEEMESDMTHYEAMVEDEIDLSELVREHLILELNPYGVCSEDCEGLAEQEKYADDGVDPRWLDLLEMSKKMNK